jgi:two-component system, OmpR family, alkaline phosphatase synthesis response regulator PhoP
MAAHQKKLLIAEDDSFLSKVMSSTLSEAGYEIDTATEGKTALEKIKANHYDLVLLDLIMPMMTGFEVLENVKKEKIKVPILVFSNLSQSDDRTEALKLGAKDYFIKSDMSIDDILKTIKKYIGK